MLVKWTGCAIKKNMHSRWRNHEWFSKIPPEKNDIDVFLLKDHEKFIKYPLLLKYVRFVSGKMTERAMSSVKNNTFVLISFVFFKIHFLYLKNEKKVIFCTNLFISGLKTFSSRHLQILKKFRVLNWQLRSNISVMPYKAKSNSFQPANIVLLKLLV